MLGLLAFHDIGISQDQPNVVVFNSPKMKESPGITEKNVLKFGVLDAVSGNFSFYYERKVHENFTLELGLGVTLSDYVTSFINDDLDVFDPNYVPKLGNAFSLGFKYFPNGNMEDFYFGLDFKHKTYINDRMYNFTTTTYEEKRSINVTRLSFGYNYFIDNKILFDLFGGFGIGTISEKTTSETATYDSSIDDFVYSYNTTELSRLAPRVHVGIKIGVVF